MKKLILILLLSTFGIITNAQVKLQGSMPYEFTPGATSVVTINFESLSFWEPGEWIIIKIPATNTGTVKINTESATMGATTQIFAAGAEVLIPPIRIYKNMYVQFSQGADKIFIYR